MKELTPDAAGGVEETAVYTKESDSEDQPAPAFIVGIGASAGGLEALENFFAHMPVQSGLAFVVVQHLSPDYKSLMAELLAKHTNMPIFETEDGMTVNPNTIYLIPRKKNMTIFHGRLFLTDRRAESGLLHLPIDLFLQSLAEDQGEKAIAIILSGTGSDGTRGVRAVKEAGGLVMAQDENTARFDGMPRSAVATQLVDYVLPPEKMPQELVNFVQHPCLKSSPATGSVVSDEDTLSKIFALLRRHSGVDFSFYKQNTMIRRIERRLSINQIERLTDYLNYLYQSPSELHTLYKEMLIGVTRFFRDPEAFEYIKGEVLPEILGRRSPREQMRVWIAGCSTGEEAYSTAILFCEVMELMGIQLDVKIFATDIDKDALDIASRGVYPESIVADVSPERLRKYFIKKGDSYEILRQVREMVIFARQNILKDPPFSKINLISCRNVLIYLQPILQKRVLELFEFSLLPDGYLFLGSSETLGQEADSFRVQQSKWRIYQYKGGYQPLMAGTQVERRPEVVKESLERPRSYKVAAYDKIRKPEQDLYRTIIDAAMPPSIVIDENMELIHAFGPVNQFLQVPTGGRVSLKVNHMVSAELSIPLSTAVHRVLKEGKEVVYQDVPHDRVPDKTFDLRAQAITDPMTQQPLILIQFDMVKRLSVSEPKSVEMYDQYEGASRRIQDLEQELQYTRENLQATIEELETSNEELQATNEELLAANEELQSTNEELQSVNEELITVNAEYQVKIQELTELNNDVNNLFSSTEIGTIFLDNDLCIRKFTPAAQREINLIEGDINRPLSHISHNIVNCNLAEEAEIVLDTLVSRRRKVKSRDGRWYWLKILPYRTQENAIRGIVMTLVDITELEEVTQQLSYQARVLRNMPHAMIATDLDYHIQLWSHGAVSMFGYTADEAEGESFLTLLKAQFAMKSIEKLRSTLQERGFWSGDGQLLAKDGETQEVWTTVSVLHNDAGESIGLVIVNRDKKNVYGATEALMGSEAQLALAVEVTGVGVYNHPVPVGRAAAYNDRCLQILGMAEDKRPAPEDFISWLIERTHPEDKSHLEATYDDFLAGRQRSVDLIVRLQHRDGHWVRIHWEAQALQRRDDDRPEHVVGVILKEPKE